MSWQDGSGDLWLFGGVGYAEGGGSGILNDLWKFDGTNWTWVGGSKTTAQYGVYGTKGVAASGNVPGARYGSVSWIDTGGNLWLFGGDGYAAGGSVGSLNDLWKYSPSSSQWTWVSGSSAINQPGVYGTKGVANSDNVPGARSRSVSWIDAGGNLWLFGGDGYAAGGSADHLNDMWKFNGINWTWVSGSNATNQPAVYGTKGVAASSNVPGARYGSVSWIDASGNFWLFGGDGYTASSFYGNLSDLWKFNGSHWVWISGSTVVEQSGIYGIKGTAASGNVPGARYGSVSWIDASGNLWLFGGAGHAASSIGLLNDLWKFDGVNWTWVSGSDTTAQAGLYGTKGVRSPGNMPGARGISVSWRDNSGNLWLFGGSGLAASGSVGDLNDLWRFTFSVIVPDVVGMTQSAAGSAITLAGLVAGTVTNSYSSTVPSGSVISQSPTAGSSVATSSPVDIVVSLGPSVTVPNVVGMTRSAAESAILSASLAVGTVSNAFSGIVPADSVISQSPAAASTVTAGSAVDIVVSLGPNPYSAMWTWVSGSNTTTAYGVYGEKGVANPENVPGVRRGSVTWTAASGNLWLFGGFGNATWNGGALNDLWKFDGTNWTWVSGSNNANQLGVYGTQGVANSENVPGARENSLSWIDASGNFWLFGGKGYAEGGSADHLNDLWKFDGANWTWVSGSNTTAQYGVYGTRGVANSGNVPGARENSVSWFDAGGNLWLFGGSGYTASGIGYLNDLWKFDGVNWTWVSGAQMTNQLGLYGTKGVAASGNVPGARYDSVSWIDVGGNLWLCGGGGYAASGSADYLNDLWKFNGINWTWVSGSNAVGQPGGYGTKGLAAPGNVPGARSGSVSWIDTGGNLWLFGGYGWAATSGHYWLNDLWQFDGTNWTWVSGSSLINQPGVYGSKGVAAPNNVPGARYDCVSWTDTSGNLRLFGGSGYAASGWGPLNDLWKFGNPEQAPEIAVEQPAGTNLANGGSTDFGIVAIGSDNNLAFIIRNTGNADLTGLVVIKDGPNPDDFTVTSSPVAPVSGPGGTTAFIVQFAPGAAGSRSAVIHIASNDSDENPFDINLTGTGLASAIQAWRQTYFGTTGNTGNAADTADPYHTGIPNLLVFAFAGPTQNPVSAKFSQLPQVQKIGDNLLFSFTQPAGVSGVTYGAEWSQTLLPGSWMVVADTGTPPQHTFSVPMEGKARMFMRLKVTNP